MPWRWLQRVAPRARYAANRLTRAAISALRVMDTVRRCFSRREAPVASWFAAEVLIEAQGLRARSRPRR